MVLPSIPTFFVREENSLELVRPKDESLGMSLKQTQILLSLSIQILRGFSQVQQQTMSSLLSLMGVFGLLDGMTIIKEGLKGMNKMIRE